MLKVLLAYHFMVIDINDHKNFFLCFYSLFIMILIQSDDSKMVLLTLSEKLYLEHTSGQIFPVMSNDAKDSRLKSYNTFLLRLKKDGNFVYFIEKFSLMVLSTKRLTYKHCFIIDAWSHTNLKRRT